MSYTTTYVFPLQLRKQMQFNNYAVSWKSNTYRLLYRQTPNVITRKLIHPWPWYQTLAIKQTEKEPALGNRKDIFVMHSENKWKPYWKETALKDSYLNRQPLIKSDLVLFCLKFFSFRIEYIIQLWLFIACDIMFISTEANSRGWYCFYVFHKTWHDIACSIVP